MTSTQRQEIEPAGDTDATTNDTTALRSDVDALRHDVDRAERQLQSVVDQYEAVLTDVTWEYESRLDAVGARRDDCQCAVHRLARWLRDTPGGL